LAHADADLLSRAALEPWMEDLVSALAAYILKRGSSFSVDTVLL
jgi:hypothetical protein